MRQFHQVSSNDPSAASLGDLLGDAASQGPEVWILRSQTSAPCEASAKLLRRRWVTTMTMFVHSHLELITRGIHYRLHQEIKNQQEPRQKNFQAVMNIVCSAKHCVLCPHAILCSECACCRSLCLSSSTKISVFDWVWFCYIKSMSTMHIAIQS